MEETIALLGQPLPGTFSLGKVGATETVDLLNAWLRRHGIGPQKLRVELGPDLEPAAAKITGPWLEEIQMQDVSFAEILRYACGAKKIYYRVKPGVIQFRCASSEMYSDKPSPDVLDEAFGGPDPVDANDPGSSTTEPPFPPEEDPFQPSPSLPNQATPEPF